MVLSFKVSLFNQSDDISFLIKIPSPKLHSAPLKYNIYYFIYVVCIHILYLYTVLFNKMLSHFLL